MLRRLDEAQVALEEAREEEGEQLDEGLLATVHVRVREHLSVRLHNLGRRGGKGRGGKMKGKQAKGGWVGKRSAGSAGSG